MGLKLDVTADGVKYLPYAKKKLAEMKVWMAHAGLGSFTKNLVFSDGARAQLNVWGGVTDFIRITAGLKYLFDAEIYPEITYNIGALIIGVNNNVGTRFLSLQWPDGSTYVVPGYSGSVTYASEPAPAPFGGTHNIYTFTNYPVGDDVIVALINGEYRFSNTIDAATYDSDSRVYTYTDLRDTAIEQTRAKISADPIDPLITFSIEAGHPSLGRFWFQLLDGSFAIYTNGYEPEGAVIAPITEEHPYLNPIIVYADKETMTLVELDYTYVSDVYTTNGPPAHSATVTPTPPARVDGAYYSTSSGPTAVTLARATTYTYHSDTATWTAGATRAIAPTQAEIAVADPPLTDTEKKLYQTTTYWGSSVFVSKGPVTGKGIDRDELESTYNSQSATLNGVHSSDPPLTLNKLLRAVRDRAAV